MLLKQKINLAGWLVFAVALVVYGLTMAPTASFWDCGEFIACANELEVTHPPGAPLFLLLGRIFAMFAFGKVDQIAHMINYLSVLSGAFTALFTAWITIIFALKGLKKSELPAEVQEWSALAAGVISGLTCTFADSIWFNSVEAEVYAMSSFFTALVVWLMLKWEARADEPGNLRWIVLIAYVMGLSMGVHLLNLLAIPAMALIYYFRKHTFSIPGFLLTMGISLVILAGIQYGILQYTFSIAWWFEKIFTGTITREGTSPTGMGLPMGTGATLFVVLLVGILTGLIWYSNKRKWIAVNVAALGTAVVYIGFASYLTIFLRSQTNPPIDMNNPENLLTFLSYMKREQYGERPLVRGPLYNATPMIDSRGYPEYKIKGKKYMLVGGEAKYVEDVEDITYQYKSEDQVFFPRMWDANHYDAGAYGYKNYVRRKGRNLDSPYDDKPTRGEDMAYAWEYQFMHMYVRYFMWNFAGKNSDIQDDGYPTLLTLFSSPSQVPGIAANKGHNNYYFLPLLLGLLGLVWQFFQRGRDGLVVSMLFLLTGVGIIIYLNQYPMQPRERDYSYAGSFQTFAIWVGMGLIFLVDIWHKWLKKLAVPLAFTLALAAPVLMGFQNWDDHTRKNRWVDIEFAKNLLDSCAPNAILFTGGDNDTFPLWYVQEVEGYRNDVRVVNLELLISDWYIDQMRESKNGAEPLPIEMEKSAYNGEKGRVIYDVQSQVIAFPLDKKALLENGVLNAEEVALVADTMNWTFPARGSKANSYIFLKDSVILNMVRNIAADNWKRPVYFANTMPGSSFLGLDNFLRLEGMAYRLVPLERSELTNNDLYYGTIDQETLRKNLTDSFKFNGLNDAHVNLDEHIRSVIMSNYRTTFFRLTNSYVEQYLKAEKEGDTATATAKQAIIREIVTAGEAKMPHAVVPRPLNLLITQAQLLDRVHLDDLAADEFRRVMDVVPVELQDAADRGEKLDASNLTLRSGMIAIQYLARVGRLEDARKLSATIASISGVDAGESIIQDIIRKQGSPAPNPKP